MVKKTGEDHSKKANIDVFINIAVILFMTTFIAIIISGAFVKIFTL